MHKRKRWRQEQYSSCILFWQNSRIKEIPAGNTIEKGCC